MPTTKENDKEIQESGNKEKTIEGNGEFDLSKLADYTKLEVFGSCFAASGVFIFNSKKKLDSSFNFGCKHFLDIHPHDFADIHN